MEWCLTVLTALFILSMSIHCCADNMLETWRGDIEKQQLARRPKLEARYTNATRTAYEIDAEKYHLLVNLHSEQGQRISAFEVRTSGKSENLLIKDAAYLELIDADGNKYTTLNSRNPSRINIYRRGPYYVETHWLDVEFADSDGNVAPVKGEVIFYCYPEKTHVGVILHVTDALEVQSSSIVFNIKAATCASIDKSSCPEGVRINDFCLMVREDNKPSCAILYPAPNGVKDVTLEKIDNGVRVRNFLYNAEACDGGIATWKADSKQTCYFAIMPLKSSEVSQEMEAEIKPLLVSNVKTKSGAYLGYDPVRGCYKIQTDNPGNFNYHYYKAPNAYEVATFSIENNNISRKIYILHETRKNPGYVECGVVLDKYGYTLPITVQISKNFAGEIEEPFYNPNDAPFSETFFPLHLGENENRELTSLHLYQNWGNHPLKQFSSLGAWMDYYHMSTGVTETTCYVPFKFGGISGVAIADLRPMSQEMWEDQPQHHNIAGHSFLRYRDGNGIWHYIEYRGTTFRSTGPNWADVSMYYLSDDGKAIVTLDIFELPQTDELRNFVHMRVDFLDDITIKEGNIAENFILLQITSLIQEMRYTHVAYGGPTGEATVVPIRLNNDFTLTGAELPAENAFATIYPDEEGANAYIIRSFDGKLDGNNVKPGVSVKGFNSGDANLMLVPSTNATQIKKGDYLEIDMILMPYGGGTQDYKPAQKCAFDYGLNAPRVTSVTTGSKLNDFPTRIELNEDGKAEFTVTGGFNTIPIIVEGTKDYRYLRLYEIKDGEKVLLQHSRKNELDGYQIFPCESGKFGFVFLVEADGQEHTYFAD